MPLDFGLAHGQQPAQFLFPLIRLIGGLRRRRLKRICIARCLLQISIPRIDVVLAILEFLLEQVELLLLSRDDFDEVLFLRKFLEQQIVDRRPMKLFALHEGLLSLGKTRHHLFNLTLAGLYFDLFLMQAIVESELLPVARRPNFADASDLALALAQFVAQDLKLTLRCCQFLATDRRPLLTRSVGQELCFALGNRGKGARQKVAIVFGNGAAPLALGHRRWPQGWWCGRQGWWHSNRHIRCGPINAVEGIGDFVGSCLRCFLL